ncbi:MAG: energy transducer TonB family protein [Nitrospirota bacterium]
MKDHIKAFRFSLLLHLVAIISLLAMSTRFVHTGQVLVIDLSDAYSLSLQNQGTPGNKSAPYRTVSKNQETDLQKTVMHPVFNEPAQEQMQPPGAEQKEEIEPEPPISSFASGQKSSPAVDNPLRGSEPPSLEGFPGLTVGHMAAPVSGGIENAGNAVFLKKHFLSIREIIQRNTLYPVLARRMGWEGKVIISFLLMPDGKVLDIRITKSSGHEILDRNAVETIKRVSPFPPPPLKAEITVPVVYALR